jgi:hypothetical protein
MAAFLVLLLFESHTLFPNPTTLFRGPVGRASKELKSTLLKGFGNRLADGERARVDGLITELRDARVRWDPRVLDRGLWCVAYMSGTQPRWSVGGRNLAGQQYELSRGLTTNYAEVLGPSVSLIARADLREANSRQPCCPKDFALEVTSAAVQLSGLTLRVPIRGRGVARLLYGDEGVRIFISPAESESGWEEDGLIVCQMPAQLLLGDANWTPPAALGAL